MKNIFLSVLFLLSSSAMAKSIATTKTVDVQKFVGKWYAISSLPLRFSKKCLSQTAEYKVLTEKSVSVFNTCFKEKGKKTTIKGKAYVRNAPVNSKLYVKFDRWWARLFNIKGDYNIIKIDDNYEYVMVGGQDRKSLWIMSRRPSMPVETLNEYVEYAKSLKFPVKKLRSSVF